jgi:hypothetical protein
MPTNSKHLFKKFLTFELSNSEIIYVNKKSKYKANEILNSCRYSSNSNDSNLKNTKEFLADRYGGDGILRHGGSGRCGFDGQFQIKGIGSTPLIGIYEYGNYRDGNLSLYDAYYETILGEVLEKFLPWGALCTNAIIIKNIDKNSIQDSCLLIRDFPIRPAHFMRAPFYKNNDGEGSEIDLQRTNEMLRLLPSILICEKIICEDYVLKDSLEKGLIEISLRLASQMAFARKNEILHGSISASNLQLNGKWMDLGCSIFWNEKLGNYKKFLDFHEKELFSTLKAIGDLCFYVAKIYFDLFNEEIHRLIFNIKSIFIDHYKTSTTSNSPLQRIHKDNLKVIRIIFDKLKNLKESNSNNRIIFEDLILETESLN